MTAVRHANSPRAAERRRSLIEAAYRIIAEQGLKGLRTRAVAAQVGLTHATLHYYFPTKEALIQAVIDYAVFQRLLAGIPLFPEDRVGTPVEQLRALLLGLEQSMREDMTNVRVLYELILHTQHNPAMRDLFLREEVFGNWYHGLKGLLEQGIQQGQWRADLDPGSASSVLITFILGLGIILLVPLPTPPEQLFDQLIQLLTGK
jgi:TetR/AcrR family transcriptional regulator, regulator of cefoperazone and chloramphenicol sensitivity